MRRSKPPYRATCSTMWSRKARPVETSARPRPSRSTRAESWVSLLLRSTRPRLLKTNLDSVGVPAKTLEVREANGRVAKRLQVAPVQAEDARPLEECVHAERRRETRCAGGWQRVVGTRRVIAKRHSRVLAD